jgi:hypothetical protein
VEVQTLEEEKRVRGKLAAGGWISISNTENGYAWAEIDGPEASKPLKYRVVHHRTLVSPAPKPDSGKPLRELSEGDLIEIVEVWNLTALKRTRGRLAGGGWISIANTENGFAWAQPEAAEPLGKYRVVHHGTMVGGAAKPDSKKQEATRELAKGHVVDIVEIRILEKEKRIRGRLATGGWVSLSNTENGYVWAQPEKA